MLKNFVLFLVLTCAAVPAYADAPLKTALALDSVQAHNIAAIETEVRRKFASLRQEHNRFMHAARRAGLANDDVEKARFEAQADAMLVQMQALRCDEEARIRKTCTRTRLSGMTLGWPSATR